MSIFILHDNEKVPRLLIETNRFDHGDSYQLSSDKNKVIVQWGVGEYSSETLPEWILNGAEGLKNCSFNLWKDILPLHGLQVGEEEENYQKKYLVYVFQLKVFGIYLNKRDVWLSKETHKKKKFQEIPLEKETREINRIRDRAVRAIHAVGLDFGMVRLGVRERNYTILDINPTPQLTPKIAKRFGEVLSDFAHEIKRPIDPDGIILGADPEFVLRHQNGKFVLASRFFQKQGEVGCDQIWLRGDRTKSKLPIVELRPEPSSDPKKLVFNIYSNLVKASKAINDPKIEFLAGSTPLKGYPIGGHIHFSNVSLNSFLLRALDNYLTIPCYLLEDPNGIERRPKYGYIGDFRHQFHGGFEYRTLPSWLVSPRVTKGVIALAKVIAVSYPKLRRIPSVNRMVQKAFYMGDQEKLYDVVEFLWSELEELLAYKENKAYLDPLKESILNHKKWNENVDIRPRWRIPPFKS